MVSGRCTALVHAKSSPANTLLAVSTVCSFVLKSHMTRVSAAPPSAVFLPQNQMNTVVGHAGGKDQAHVILAIQAIEPSYFSSQKA